MIVSGLLLISILCAVRGTFCSYSSIAEIHHQQRIRVHEFLTPAENLSLVRSLIIQAWVRWRSTGSFATSAGSRRTQSWLMQKVEWGTTQGNCVQNGMAFRTEWRAERNDVQNGMTCRTEKRTEVRLNQPTITTGWFIFRLSVSDLRSTL